MATQDLITQATEGNTLVTPDEDGFFTLQTKDGPEKFCLIRPFSMNDIPKPPPASVRKQLKRKFYEFRDKYYARKLAGTTGKLTCGVTWRLSFPPEDYESRSIRTKGLILDFDDPASSCVAAGGFHFVHFDFEEAYRNGRLEHVRRVKLRNLVPAEPGDPDGFLVKWKRRE